MSIFSAIAGGTKLPPFPCGVCTIEVESGARHDAPELSATIVLGTPVCTHHGVELLAAVGIHMAPPPVPTTVPDSSTPIHDELAARRTDAQ